MISKLQQDVEIIKGNDLIIVLSFEGFSFPRPELNTSSLTMEELRAMEGETRESDIARISVLRNVHSLLDTAITQLNQYSQAAAATQV